MSDQYIGEIRAFGCSFAPRGFAQCNGQLLPIAQNTALFSLLGTSYGGDGRSNFGLPNLQGKAALNQGQGGSQPAYYVGQTGGVATVTLTQTQMPMHNHTAMGGTAANSSTPAGLTWANPVGRPAPSYFADTVGNAQTMSQQALFPSGSGLPHNNLMPYVVINFCIALQGIFPQRP